MASDEQISVRSATLYTAGAKYATAILQILFTMILARLLTPEQYGIVAVATVFISLFQLFADMGLGTGVIQNKTLSDRDIDNIYSFSIYQGIILMVLFIIFSYPLSIFYEDEIYIPIGSLLSLSVLFSSFNMIPNAVMLRCKKFKSIAIRTITVTVVASCLTIFMAFYGWGVYAIVFNSVLTNLFLFLWNELSVRLKFTFLPSFDSVKKIFGYSFFQFLSMLINYFCRHLDQMLCGKYISKNALGHYNKSYSLITMPIFMISGVLNSVLQPILSDHQNNTDLIYGKYMRVLDFLAIISFFLSGFFFLAGKEIIMIFFGDQWDLAVTPFKIIGLSLWAQMLTNTTGTIYQSIGNTRLMFKNTIFTSAIVICAIIIGVIKGSIIILSCCISIAYIIVFFVSFGIMVKGGFAKELKQFFCFFIPNILMMFSILSCVFIVPTIDNIYFSAICKFAISLSIWSVFVIIAKKRDTLLYVFKR